ncbi:class I SAM-dependent methyltransferase [Micromonospora echinofusca]|uniref:Methyltransferase domain-containing protein n=1 Tax=Micromonospora echinofusca TaxID=47858 RepID=A0ABS3W1M5_MICEH|nr:class I SAM-dependent methyltransferase [Micromonospora echinofusca]MBO4210692.1 methyltransferase domain-containing protein [Micromonospora echinofusca]
MTDVNQGESLIAGFEAFYNGKSPVDGMTFAALPWDIGEPQPRVVDSVRAGRFSGRVLDSGCGLGDNTIHLTGLGYDVLGVDGAPTAVEWARRRARAQGVPAQFAVADVTRLDGYEDSFDSILDSGVYDCFDAELRRRYVAALHRAARPGARFILYCLSDLVPCELPGVYRIDEQILRDDLGGGGWPITDLRRDTFLVNEYAGHFFREQGLTVDFDDRGRVALPAWAVEAVRA